MTTPENPYDPAQNPPPPPGGGYGQPPAYGAPQYGQQPAPYGQAPYGQAPYGQPGVAYQGTLVLWPTRAGGFLIDIFLAAIPAWILEVIALSIKSGALFTVASLVGLGIWIWNWLREARTGQTVGKSVMGTYLVKEADGQFLSGPMCIVRGLLHVVDTLACFIGYFWPIWDAKRQTFSDKIVGTVVVKR